MLKMTGVMDVLIPEIRKRAESGDATAQYGLGKCYLTGEGVKKDKEEAVKWFLKSAEQDFAEAQYWLGICYLEGLGVEKDKKAAVEWFRKAAKQGHESSISTLRTLGESIPEKQKEDK